MDSFMSAPAILVDGSSYLFRAYHAMPPLTNSEGHPTGAIRGVINMMRSLQKGYPESQIIVIFDAKGKTFRNDMYPEYKANRPSMPDELRVQIQPIHDIIKAMGLPLLVIPDVEADDVIGTLADQATTAKRDVIISTGDKDMAQLVNEHVSLINTMTDTFMDVEGVVEKFGVRPDQIIDYLSLMGDKVDNIPGVEKCGPKTAVKWLTAYETMQGVMDNADAVKGKIGENLRAALDFLPLSYELATIKLDVELEHSLTEIETQPVDKDALLASFNEFEFKTWVTELGGKVVEKSGASKSASADAAEEVAIPDEITDTDYQTIFDQAQLDEWFEKLNKAELFAFDTETTSLNYMDAEIVGLSFSVEAGKAAYVPLAHTGPDTLLEDAPVQLDRDAVLAQFKPLLEDANSKKVGQHLKYDAHVLANYGIELKGIQFDTMLESYVLNSVASRHDMDSLAKYYLNTKTTKFEEVAGKGAKQITFDKVEIEVAGPYAAEDADITLRLHQTLWAQLNVSGKENLKSVFETIELPLVDVLTKIEANGALIDADILHEQSAQLSIRLAELEQQAHDVAGQVFNLGSPKQLAEILFEKLELPVVKKTPKGAPSTAEEVLVQLAEDYELPKLILENRSLSKLKSTYTDKLPLMICQRTGRVHTSYHQATAVTGRLSSTEPNLQNIPIKSEEGRRIRDAFIAPEGYTMVAADYSQIELRIMAHLSNDAGLLTAFANGIDVHTATAAEVFGVTIENVEPNMRRSAKAINFGLIYGMSAFGLAKQLGIGRGQAQEYVDLYFERYPGVKSYMDNTRADAADIGYVETIFGRRLYLPDINAKNAPRRQHAERTAINAPMQGTAADIIKKAMIKVAAWLATGEFDAKMIMQVHDELVLEVKTEQLEAFKAKLKEIMEDAAELAVPLIVEVDSGKNWGEAH
ncbi:DNA polymerase I [Oleispira antarctica]|uniref:DNA polymerase I n=1 Tax=Oleispira antarctica TaxID=188908 RepID=A0A1Y5HFH3_OLEAN|nr:DNA polymerase I [Oleispira antarctica]